MKLVKVTFEYEDGAASYIDGKDAEMFQEGMYANDNIAELHGCNFWRSHSVNWKPVEREANKGEEK